MIIGIDPDANKHGVAVYNNELIRLAMMSRKEIIQEFKYCHDVVFSIENVLLTNAIFPKHLKGVSADKVKMNIALKVGKNQQALQELIADLEHHNLSYILQKPSSEWKKNKPLFEKVTSWTKKSNEDTRSAAYFGWLVASMVTC
jgi:hypothetical protein